ncbi:methylenetetrahydrofolate reductase C-terminal domain-containing protein [Fuchsiella alkaliacetigena]|uniref:methylenetetrahydrofolate reductase C-terminal domain-containing protein n=1 Tax=Fuchsiella alkaliacetigena TaxID=957042 RepID=UPI00200ADE0D|nr:methylenetetrahydrofolate reductase C-terminal domain-containing protein [Fuchsiella alkaliacetigena]MCK8825189.1 methylenetetrahydrofolate reductase C-terminal domain-containing protein [Fuchsiella alkaliacetigena]
MSENPLKESILNDDEFTLTWELVPGRGAREKNQEAIFEGAEKAIEGGLIDAITITENPGGNPAISAEYLGMKLKEMGIEPLVHFTCKDKSRNQIESFLYSLERENVGNILVMTGDYPVSGYNGTSKPVYDFDPVHIVELITDLNGGLEYKDAFGRSKSLKPTNFFPGVAVSPFKRLESEQMAQYYKLKKKVEAGAQYIIPQLGYDARKFHELIKFVEMQGWDIPIIGNVYLLHHGASRAMNANRIPGCVVTDDLVAELAQEKENSDDGGHHGALMRAAKMYAFKKGMGFAGVHIAGHGMSYEDLEFIIEKGEELAPNWRDYLHEFDFPMEDGFYYFEKDEETGLNTDKPAEKTHNPSSGIVNRSFRIMHHALFEPHSPLFGIMQGTCAAIEDSALEGPFELMERVIKTISNECQECGDCALFDLAYLCPMSQCPKNQRNGACGGSKDGWCEIYYGEQKCIYVRAYDRLKAHGEEEQLQEYIVPPVDWDLYQTSSWINFYMGRDHVAERIGVTPPGEDGEGKKA